DGTIASYKWRKVSGPLPGTISSPNSANTSVNSLVLGVYQFELQVTDNNAATGKDTVQVTINAAPVANAGRDIIITLPANTATLNGSGTDLDGSISGYAWTKISGPSGSSITNGTSSKATAKNLVKGIYKFQLKVTDNWGATGKDTVQVIVNAANQSPIANAGSDRTINLPVDSVYLTGSGT